ncbi:uncharacterized protein LOC143573787 [Bidens hawaiensis]|uniref:uncharacterized protein LOC143573787 n=1 Tax=Bidens hawaiensis TaxID=980011 RepID=UPI00404B5E1E
MSDDQTEPPVQSSFRAKLDKAWDYVTCQKDEKGKLVYICDFCLKVVRGGSITRMKKHLAGVKGDVEPCKKVSADVRFTTQGLLKETEVKARGKSIDILDGDEEVEEVNEQSHQIQKRKRKATPNVHPFFTKATTDPSQPTIKKAMQSKEKVHDVDLTLAMWFYDACIPTNACNSPYYQLVVDKIASVGYGYKAPKYHAIRINLLKDAKTSVGLLIDSYRSDWVESGCTIMADGWRDIRHRHLINFLVAEMVGVKNVVQIVTDNAAKYKCVGQMLCQIYRSITWTPCAAHCLNLALKDVSELENVAKLVKLASKVTFFIYNHKMPLNWLRKREGWTEIMHPGPTRFGTTFIALKSLVDHKNDLQALAISNEFKKMLKLGNAIECREILMNEVFWRNCLITVTVMTPLLRVLRLCDTDEKPSLPYVFEGMNRANKGIKALFQEKEHLYKPYTDIINARWKKMLCSDIHCAAYWLNPAFQYDKEIFCKSNEVFRGVLDMVENTFSGDDVLDVTMTLCKFRDAKDSEWWRLFGGDYPKMQTFAIRILSQTASSSGCERNWSVFERIHMKRRNRLEHERLNDLVLKYAKRSYDLVDYESINHTEFWVVEEEPEGELNNDDIDTMFGEEENEPVSQTQGNKSVYTLVDEDGDESEFHLLSNRGGAPPNAFIGVIVPVIGCLVEGFRPCGYGFTVIALLLPAALRPSWRRQMATPPLMKPYVSSHHRLIFLVTDVVHMALSDGLWKNLSNEEVAVKFCS